MVYLFWLQFQLNSRGHTLWYRGRWFETQRLQAFFLLCFYLNSQYNVLKQVPWGGATLLVVPKMLCCATWGEPSLMCQKYLSSFPNRLACVRLTANQTLEPGSFESDAKPTQAQDLTYLLPLTTKASSPGWCLLTRIWPWMRLPDFRPISMASGLQWSSKICKDHHESITSPTASEVVHRSCFMIAMLSKKLWWGSEGI